MTSRIIRTAARLLIVTSGFSAIGAFLGGWLAFVAGENAANILLWGAIGNYAGACLALALAWWGAE